MSVVDWDESYPPSLFVPPAPPVIPVTGVTAGAPGAFAPGNATLPADIAAVRADPVVGTAGTSKPGAAWLTGEYVVLGNASHAYWDGATWQTGSAPVVAAPESRSKGARKPERGATGASH